MTKILDSILLTLNQVADFFHAQQACVYLVGGSIRNLMLNEPCTDWDLVTNGEAHRLARQLADQLGGFYAHLHEKASRVTIRRPGASADMVLDISPLREETIEQNLLARDFTLNALAAPLAPMLESLLKTGSLDHAETFLVDPAGGLPDLRAHLIRAVDSDVFRRDPLRMLRALRLARRYALTIDPGTTELIQRDAALLTSVATERIHDELYLLLNMPGTLEQLHLLETYGLLPILIPELQSAHEMRQPTPHYWDVFEHSLQSVAALEYLATCLEGPAGTPFPPELASTPEADEDLAALRELLHEAEQDGVFCLADLHTPRAKLAALLHDIGKPLTYTMSEQGAIHFYNHPLAGAPVASEIMHRLNASTQDRRLAFLVAAHHMRPGQLGQESILTQRAIRRYFVDLGPTGVLVALFSLADHLATLGPQPRTTAWLRHLAVVRLLLTRYIREREQILPPRLVRADELMSRLKIAPGPILGQLLELIAEAQTDGTIHSREEAILLAREYVQAHTGA